MMRDCKICQGRGYIKLPLYHSVRLWDVDVPPILAEGSHKTYNCPECKDASTADDRVDVFHNMQSFPSEYLDIPDAMQAMKKGAARELAHFFLEKDYISFRITSDRMGRNKLFASAGVVSPSYVASIEKRALDKAKDFLRGVKNSAAARIRVWGSHYTAEDGYIPKGQAVGFMQEAFDQHMKEIETSPLSCNSQSGTSADRR